MKNLICFCIRHPVTMIMILAALFLGGVVSFLSMPLSRLPEINFPRVMVETFYPGMGAEEIRSSLTIPLEDALSPVKGLQGLHSISRDGSSLVILNFRWGSDPQTAASLVREAIDTVYPVLPAGAGKPAVIAGDPDEEPFALAAIRSPGGNNAFVYNLAEYDFRSRFRRLDGVGRIVLSGAEREEIRISTDPERSALRGFNGDDLARIIASETADTPGGSAREGNLELTVVSAGRPKLIEELSSIVLPSTSIPLKLTDVAITARDRAPKKSVFIFQNEEQTVLEIYRRPGADPLRLSREIKKTIDEINDLFPNDIECVLVCDASSSILESVINLIVSAVLGAVAVALILFFFMNRRKNKRPRRLRFSLLAASAIPVSAAAALIVLQLTGRSLNSMSLGGLALGIGLVSDCSVIVLDMLRKKKKNDPCETAALTASVSNSSFAGTLTTAVVFLPVVFLPGPLGSLFGDLASALIASVIMGWLYSQFFLPSLFSLFGEESHALPSASRQERRASEDEFSSYDEFSSCINPQKKNGLTIKYYRPLLKTALRRSNILVICAVVSSITGIAMLFSRPLEFAMPEAFREIELSVDFPAGMLLDAASAEALKISTILFGLPCISSFYGKMGAEDEDTGRRCDPAYRKEKILFRCFLRKGVNAAAALADVRAAFLDEERFTVAASYPLEKTAKILGLSALMTFAIKGNGTEETSLKGEAAAETLRRGAGKSLSQINLRPSGTRPELRLVPNREAAASVGISATRIAGAVYAATEGIVAGNLEIDGLPLDVRVAGSAENYTATGLEKLPLAVANSGREISFPVFLETLAKIEWREAKIALARQDRSDVVYLDILPAPEKEKEVSRFIKKLPDDLSRADESAFIQYRSSLIAALVLVILLLYLCLAAQFESFVLPLVLMLSIPFSLAGAGPFLFFSASAADSGSILGLIVLFGLAVNNGLVLYEISEEKMRSGLSPLRAVFSGSLDRFEPVLITSLTTIAALIPLAVMPGSSQRSMALAMLGGICASTALSFLAMPPVFAALLKSKEARARRLTAFPDSHDGIPLLGESHGR